ncbi:MAG: hypothetical protein LBS29_03620 [Endomicrobium sp.]|jgi:hypothetical protein|nr:hypothetical protein [Endomicrobium sp.]
MGLDIKKTRFISNVFKDGKVMIGEILSDKFCIHCNMLSPIKVRKMLIYGNRGFLKYDMMSEESNLQFWRFNKSDELHNPKSWTFNEKNSLAGSITEFKKAIQTKNNTQNIMLSRDIIHVLQRCRGHSRAEV